MKRGVRGSRRRLCLVAMVVVVWLGGALATAPEAEACTCRRPQAVCDAVNRADLIFSGTVRSVRLLSPDQGRLSARLTTLEVREAFLGKVDERVEILGDQCDDDFRVGEVMLVYANERGQIIRSGCSRTRPLAEAQEDVKELRARKGHPHGEVVGTLTVEAPGRDPQPLAGVSVRVIPEERGPAETVTTDAQGHYQLEVPPGGYVLSIDAPPSLTSSWAPRQILDLRHPGACVRGDASFKRNGTIRGKVLGKRKKGVPGVSVYAVDATLSADEVEAVERPVAVTDPRGDFRIEGLASGTYLVMVSPDGVTAESPYPTTYAPGVRAPGQARRVDLTGEKLDAQLTLLLPPPRPVYPVTVRVLQDGRPTEKPVEISEVVGERRVLDDNPDAQGRVRVDALAGAIRWQVCVHELASRVPKKSCAAVSRTIQRATSLDVDVPSAD